MCYAGKIYHEFSRIEIAEDGTIWLTQNHFESDTVITEMESAARGEVIIDEGYDLYQEEDDYDDVM